MISRLTVRGFRGIREGVINGFSQFTVIIGKNGSGKSSILEAIYLASACSRVYDQLRNVYKVDYVVRRRGDRGDWKKARSVLWFNRDTSKPIKINLSAGGVDADIEIKSSDNRGKAVKLVSVNGKRPGRKTSKEAEKRVKETLGGVVFVDPTLLSKPRIIEKAAWEAVSTRRLDKRIVDMLRSDLAPEAEGLTYIPLGDEPVLAVQTPETTIRVDDLGDGVKAAVLLALLILGVRPSILLLEEPETHMHPAGLSTLLDFLYSLMREEGFQVIASTHSIDLVHIASSLARDYDINLSLIYLGRSSDGLLDARPFTLDDVEALRELGVDLRLAHAF